MFAEVFEDKCCRREAVLDRGCGRSATRMPPPSKSHQQPPKVLARDGLTAAFSDQQRRCSATVVLLVRV